MIFIHTLQSSKVLVVVNVDVIVIVIVFGKRAHADRRRSRLRLRFGEVGISARTLDISQSMTSAATLTPMMAQYHRIKADHPDAILLCRMGDFYEMFLGDAELAAPLLGLQLTSRDKNSANAIPMAGVPHHSAMSYIQKLLSAGHKVALCEQVESTSSTKGPLRREVVRVLTPGLIADPDLVNEGQQVRLAVVSTRENPSKYSLLILDLLESELFQAEFEDEERFAEALFDCSPNEILVPADLGAVRWFSKFKERHPRTLVTKRPYADAEPGSPACFRALEEYLKETQRLEKIPSLSSALPLRGTEALRMDSTTIQALELVPSPATTPGCSLLEAIDHTRTAFGRRRLRRWLLAPLTDAFEIQQRQDAVQTLIALPQVSDAIQSILRPIRDIERITSKLALGLAGPRDLEALSMGLKQVQSLRPILVETQNAKLTELAQRLNPMDALSMMLSQGLATPAPTGIHDGGIIQTGYNAEIDRLRDLSSHSKGHLIQLETREKTKTGISTLKVKYNRVLGYIIETSKAQASKVPSDYIRKQSVVNAERFTTTELQGLESEILSAETRLVALEQELFFSLRSAALQEVRTLVQNARALSEVDCLCSFAEAARRHGFCRPEFNATGALVLEDSWHIVVKSRLTSGTFVPNSVNLSPDSRTLLITGPNMGGKSTLMRQTALACLLGQAGSFVPAKRARLPILDAVFTRIGSSDDLAAGKSTFMMEMTEMARILKQGTERSLILIDEVGRGTSTYDGLALAWALLEYLHNQVRGQTLFATHFHELTVLESTMPSLRNAHLQAKKWGEEIVFLYQLAWGVSPRSYGIEVANLAGIPEPVLQRARQVQSVLENHSSRGIAGRQRIAEHNVDQLSLSFETSNDSKGLDGFGIKPRDLSVDSLT